MLAGLIVAMTPWWIRNARLSGRFVPTTLQVGASLYDGLNPQATGASNMDLAPEPVKDLRRRAASGEVPRDAALEVELDRRFRVAARAFARDNPARVARLAADKLRRIWNLWPNEPSFSPVFPAGRSGWRSFSPTSPSWLWGPSGLPERSAAAGRTSCVGYRRSISPCCT